MIEESEEPDCTRFHTFQTVGKERLSESKAEHPNLRHPSKAHSPPKQHSGSVTAGSDRLGRNGDTPHGPRDPEKEAVDDYQPMQSRQRSSHPWTVSYIDDEMKEDDEDNDDVKNHAVWILIYLSALAPILALPVAVYTILVTTLIIILSPILLLLNRRPLSDRFYRALAPLPIFQLGLMFCFYEANPAPYHSLGSIGTLILTNMFAPVYAMLIAVAACTGGIFWIFTAILGNPDGKDQRDDGREAVLRVRGWWERWLIKGLE